MGFPASLALITLSGTFLDGEGDPRAGVVTITLPTPIYSTGDDVIIPPFDLEVELDLDGKFQAELPATTDPEWLPNTASYVVQVVFELDFRKLWWSIPLPYDTAGLALDLADSGAPTVGTPSLSIRQGTTQPLADGGYKGTWADGSLYRAGDAVQHGSSVYGALKASSGVTPGTDVTVWKVFPSSGGGAVDSVFGRSGDVVAESGDYTKTQVGLSNVDNTSDVAKPVSTATQTALNAKADLVGGVVPTAQIPSIAVTDYLGSVASQVAMLALVGQKGDWTIRTDTGTTWVITGNDPTQLVDWTALSYPTAPVLSVNGQTGVITLVKGDVGLGSVDNTSDANKPVSTATQTALDLKAPLASPALTGTVTAVNLTMSGRQLNTPVALTDAATIAVNAALGNDFTVTLGGNRTLGNPTNPSNGQKILFAIRQDGTGSRTLTLDSDYRLGTDISAVVLSTAINKTDYLGVRYNGTDSKWDVLAFVKAY